MAIKRFSNQSGEQVIAHLKSYLETDSFTVKIDTFAKNAEIRRAKTGKKGPSKKKERIREEMKSVRPRERRKKLSAKRREKPKLKHVRNGRMISLKGYTG
jgi:hypothetical protein